VLPKSEDFFKLKVIDVLSPLGHFMHLFKMAMDTSEAQDTHRMKVLANIANLN